MTEVLVTSVLEEALKQFSDKIAKKLAEGKRLTDSEITVLLLDQMNKRMEIMNQSINKRIDDFRDSLSGRINELREDVKALQIEVSSIKSDIINLMKEKFLK